MWSGRRLTQPTHSDSGIKNRRLAMGPGTFPNLLMSFASTWCFRDVFICIFISIQLFYNSFTIYTTYTYLFYIFKNLYILLHKSVDVYRIHIYVYVYIRIRLYTYVRTYMRRRTYVRTFIPIIRHQVSPDSPTAAMAAGAMALPW